MTTQPVQSDDSDVLADEAKVARERLMAAIDRLDTRARTWVEHAAKSTRVGGWGLLGAAALWAGVVIVTHQREPRQRSAIVLRARRNTSLARTAAVHGTRLAAVLIGFLASRAFALRLIAERHALRTALPSDMPQVRRVGDAGEGVWGARRASGVETRGTPNA